jgi:23S rRNA pseudouridine1911/1915/1917 synthase
MAAVNGGWEYRTTVRHAARHPSVLAYLTAAFSHTNGAEWARRIEEGRVLLNGGGVGPAARLRDGDTLTWCRPPWLEPAAPLSYTIAHRDEHLLAVVKPAGLPTLPGGGFLENTLIHLVRRREPQSVPVHRLGRWTSGLVLFASSARARAGLAARWRRGEVFKRYRALASGTAPSGEFEVRSPIGPVSHPMLGTVHGASPDGKPATSKVILLEQRAEAFLADVVIETGRPHQIRIHLASVGHPLLGDPLYAPGGIPAPDTLAVPGDPGYLLHAAQLRFEHPVSGRSMDLASAPPARLRRTMEPGH